MQLPWATVHVRRRMCDIMTGETSVGVTPGTACVSFWRARTWIHMTDWWWDRWCRQSFHLVSLIKLTMRTTHHPAIHYESICKTISTTEDVCTSFSELTIGEVLIKIKTGLGICTASFHSTPRAAKHKISQKALRAITNDLTTKPPD